ncbi:MAG: GNAT family N-acetyltransferase [Hyphomicrobiales bacterium]
MIIRPFKPTDAPDLTEILHAAVHVIGARDYTPEQLRAWSPAPMPSQDYVTRVADGRTVLVALGASERPVAFIEIEADGHIDCFYCHPDFAGSGVGRALFRHALSHAIKADCPRLFVEASAAARRFFLREGFVVIARREFLRRNLIIHNYAMEKKLGSGGACHIGPFRDVKHRGDQPAGILLAQPNKGLT